MSVTFMTDKDPIVRYDEQTLTPEQRAQARENIGAVSIETTAELEDIRNTYDDESYASAGEAVRAQVQQLSDRVNDAIYEKLSAVKNIYETMCGGWWYGGWNNYHQIINNAATTKATALKSPLKILSYPAKIEVKEDYIVGAGLFDAGGNFLNGISCTDNHSIEITDERVKYVGIYLATVNKEPHNGIPITAEECGLTVVNATPASCVSDISNLIYGTTWNTGCIGDSGNRDVIVSDGYCIHSDYIDVSNLENFTIRVPEGFSACIFQYSANKTYVTTNTPPTDGTVIPGDKIKYIRINLRSTTVGIKTSDKYKLSAKTYVYLNAINASKETEKETEYEVTMRYAEDLKNALAAQRDLTSTAENNDSKVRLTTFVHVTDVHGDSKCFRNACEIAKHLSATALVNTGDVVFYYSGDDTSFVEDAVNENGIKYLVNIGNHDNFQYTEEQAYEKHIAPFAAENDYVFTSDNAKLTYYYKDIADKKLRVLSINQFQYSGSSAATVMHFTQEQIDFICASLLSTPQDYGVIVIMHAPEKRPVITDDYSKFFQKKLIWFNTGSENAPIRDIIDAFISGTTINKTYNNKSGTTPESFTVNADFSGKNTGVEFICYCTGHAHADSIHYVPNTTNKQLMLNATCTCSYSNKNKDGTEGNGNAYLAELSDLPRVDETTTKDAFNVYCIDRGTKSVKIVRIGSNMPYDLSEKRDYMVIPYAD